MAESIFKFGDKFGYESPFGDWRKKMLDKQNTEDEPPKILDVEVNQSHDFDFLNPDIVKVHFNISVSENAGSVKITYENTTKTAKYNLLVKKYEVNFDILILNYYKDCLFEVVVFDARNNPTEKRSILRQITYFPISYPISEQCICKGNSLSAEGLKYIVSRLRQLEETTLSSVNNKIGKNKNKLYISKEGKIIESKPNGKAPEGSSLYLIQQTQYDKLSEKLFHLKHKEQIQHWENNFVTFAKYLSLTFTKYKINTCVRKIHFLAQVYLETGRFTATYEQNSISIVSGGLFYRGRGLKQITHDYNYLEYYDYIHKTSLYSIYKKKRQGYESVVSFNERTKNVHISVNDMKKVDTFVSKLATSMKYACDAAGWYWNKNEINVYADKDDLAAVSALVNNPSALKQLGKNEKINTKNINGYEEREKYYKLLKIIFNYENCK